MAFHSKIDFSKLCGVATNYLSVAIGRKKVILTGDLIDDSIPANAAFLAKRSLKTKTVPVTDEIIPDKSGSGKETIPKPTQQSITNKELVSFQSVEMQKKVADLEKVLADTQHRNLQIEKLQGQSLPTELAKGVISQLSKTFVSTFKDGCDSLLIEISKRKTLSSKEVAELRGLQIKIINDSITKAITESKKSLKIIVGQYQEKREVGEHD